MISSITGFYSYISDHMHLYDRAFWADAMIAVGEAVWYIQSDIREQLYTNLGFGTTKADKVAGLLRDVRRGIPPHTMIGDLGLIVDTIYDFAITRAEFGDDLNDRPLYKNRHDKPKFLRNPLFCIAFCSVVENTWVYMNDIAALFDELRFKGTRRGTPVKDEIKSMFLIQFHEAEGIRRLVAYELMNGNLMQNLIHQMEREWRIVYDHPESTRLYSHEAYEWVAAHREALFGA